MVGSYLKEICKQFFISFQDEQKCLNFIGFFCFVFFVYIICQSASDENTDQTLSLLTHIKDTG